MVIHTQCGDFYPQNEWIKSSHPFPLTNTKDYFLLPNFVFIERPSFCFL